MSGVVKVFLNILKVIVAVVAGIMIVLGAPFLATLGMALAAIALLDLVGRLFSGSGTKPEAATVNSRIATAIRWINAGYCKQGGAVLFADFAAGSGDLYYLVVHSDSILTSRDKIWLDDKLVTVDGSGAVQTAAFRLTDKNEEVTTDGAGQTFLWIWTTTYTESDPTPPAISALSAAFPTQWTSDHKLVGTTFSVVRMRAMKVEDRYKMYKWRGPIGLGEPSIAVGGEWSNVYDPRDETQVLGDSTTYKPTRNSALIWAWFRTHKYGRNKSLSSINWAKVGEQADICDQTVTGIEGDHTRYRCSASIPEDMTRSDGESAIMMTMDAQIVFDDDGLCWPRCGYYYPATLSLTRNRDIVAMESSEAVNGENETQGIVVRYTDPNSAYTLQPSAAWLNPIYYDAGKAATFTTVDCPYVQDHNQAMRIAKAIGMRVQPSYKLAPTVGLRGIKARQERVINLNYDNTFAGEHEVCTQVELDSNGVFCTFGIVPVDADRWNLLSGEERPKPVSTDVVSSDSIGTPSGATVTFANNRIEATFPSTGRNDTAYEFQYIKTSDYAGDEWARMTVMMDSNFAYSGTVDPLTNYTVRYRYIRGYGTVSSWVETTLDVGVSTSALQASVEASWIVEVLDGTPIIAITGGGSLTISSHTRRYTDGHADLSITGDVIATGLSTGATRYIGYDDVGRTGGAVTFNLYTDESTAHASSSNPGRHYVGTFTVP